LKAPADGFFFANAGGKGYYRSTYPPSVYARLVAGVETRLTPTERISLIGDEWAQVQANKVNVGDYLNLAAAVKTDPNAEVIDNAFAGVFAIFEHVAGTSEEKAGVAAWLRKTFSPQYARLGPPSESDSANTRELRARLFSVLGVYGNDPAILAQARQIADQYLANPASVDSTLGLTALSIAARNGDAALFDALLHVAETSTNPEFQEGALRMLVQFEDPALLQRALDYAVSGKVRNQDTAIQFAIALSSDKNRDLAWKYIETHWDKVQAQLTPEMATILVRATGGFCSADARDDVKKFFADHKVAGSGLPLKHAVEHIDGCIELRRLQEPNLKQWLAAQAQP